MQRTRDIVARGISTQHAGREFVRKYETTDWERLEKRRTEAFNGKPVVMKASAW